MTYTLMGADGKPHESATPGTLGGNRRSQIYGRLDCPSALRAISTGAGTYEKYRVFFADERAAIQVGYRPCGTCMRSEYAAWKALRGG